MTIHSLEVLLSWCEQSLVPCPVLTVASAVRFLHTDFSEGRSGGLVSHVLKNFPQFVVIHTVKGFGIVNKAKVDVFLELSFFFEDPADVGNLISGSSAFFKYSWNIWKFVVHVLMKPGLENFEHYFASMWDDNWHCLSLGLEGKLTISSPEATAEVSRFAGILSVALSQHHPPGFEIAQLELHYLH